MADNDDLRSKILAFEDLTRERVWVPEWKTYVWVRTMRGHERDAWERAAAAELKVGTLNVRASLAVLTVCDEAGTRLFRDADMGTLAGKSAAALDRIFEVAARLNHVLPDDVEVLEKNS